MEILLFAIQFEHFVGLTLMPGYHMAAVSPPYWPHCLLNPLIDDSLIGVN